MNGKFRTSIGANRGGLEKVNASFSDFAEEYEIPDSVRRAMRVALDELVTNTISYGLPNDGGEVVVEAELHPDRLIVTVSDNGKPFDPFQSSAPDTTLSVEDRPIGGLGIHLVQHLVDD